MSIYYEQLCAYFGVGAVGFLLVAYLVAHACLEVEGAAVFQFRYQLTLQYVEDVSSLAPVIGAVAGRVLDDPDARVAGFEGVPDRGSSFSQLRFARNLGPIGGGELGVFDQHGRILDHPPPPPAPSKILKTQGQPPGTGSKILKAKILGAKS